MESFKKGEKIDFANQVGYSDGGIVSKIVMKNKGGNVTLFAFDRGQELSVHTAPFDALVQVIEGEGRFFVNGKPNDLSAGEAIIFPANVPHAVEAIQKFKMLLTMIREQ